jgi:hypothetical protein
MRAMLAELQSSGALFLQRKLAEQDGKDAGVESGRKPLKKVMR